MYLDAPSSLISGGYICLELILAVALSHLIVIILESWNIKKVYETNEDLKLSSSRLDIFDNFGLTTRGAHRIAVVIFGIFVLLNIIGGFAIVGVSGKEYAKVLVKNRVMKAPPGETIDYRKHVSVESHLVSGTVILARQHVQCVQRISTSYRVYEYVNDFDDIETVGSEIQSMHFNQSCMRALSGFEERVLLEHTVVRPSVPIDIPSCQFNFSWDKVSAKKLSLISVHQGGGCNFRIMETWCYRNEEVYCAATIKSEDLYTITMFLKEARRYTISSLYGREPPRTESLKAVALLRAARVSISISDLWLMSVLSVEKNAMVNRVVGDHDKTRVSVVLLSVAMGSSLTILVVSAVLALFAWLKFVALKGRLRYNRFSSAMDILSIAASELFNDGGSKLRRRGILVGISMTEPYVGPLREYDGGGGQCFHEEELVGPLS